MSEIIRKLEDGVWVTIPSPSRPDNISFEDGATVITAQREGRGSAVLIVKDKTGAPVFRIDADGSVHVKQGSPPTMIRDL